MATKAKTAPIALLLGLTLAPAALIGLASVASSPAHAQAAPSYEQKKELCRQEGALRQNLDGDALIRFVDQCVTQSAGSSAPAAGDAYEVKVQSCRNEGADRRGLTGDALQAYVAKCVGQ